MITPTQEVRVVPLHVDAGSQPSVIGARVEFYQHSVLLVQRIAAGPAELRLSNRRGEAVSLLDVPDVAHLQRAFSASRDVGEDFDQERASRVSWRVAQDGENYLRPHSALPQSLSQQRRDRICLQLRCEVDHRLSRPGSRWLPGALTVRSDESPALVPTHLVSA